MNEVNLTFDLVEGIFLMINMKMKLLK